MSATVTGHVAYIRISYSFLWVFKHIHISVTITATEMLLLNIYKYFCDYNCDRNAVVGYLSPWWKVTNNSISSRLKVTNSQNLLLQLKTV